MFNKLLYNYNYMSEKYQFSIYFYSIQSQVLSYFEPLLKVIKINCGWFTYLRRIWCWSFFSLESVGGLSPWASWVRPCGGVSCWARHTWHTSSTCSTRVSRWADTWCRTRCRTPRTSACGRWRWTCCRTCRSSWRCWGWLGQSGADLEIGNRTKIHNPLILLRTKIKNQ